MPNHAAAQRAVLSARHEHGGDRAGPRRLYRGAGRAAPVFGGGSRLARLLLDFGWYCPWIALVPLGALGAATGTFAYGWGIIAFAVVFVLLTQARASFRH
ncbi:hypothetical protein ACNHKD_11745 [Methylocystis sp. JAN1]|uniref:hypothetical protein n=1 Tax=Methylocystis sp. JAN1 TaxID=3397211 RepID=UPI003FA1D4B4